MSLTGKKLFGAGRFLGINNISNPTPTRFQTMQDSSIDFKAATKSLFGENRLPVAVAIGEVTITGKVTMGANNSRMFAELLFADAQTAGSVLEDEREAQSIPATPGPYTVTVTNSANWTTDLGVTKTDGTVFTRVASGPIAGQYSVAAGVYTFAAADQATPVLISYLYTNSGSGAKIVVANSPMGPAGSFTGVMVMPYGTEQDVFTFNNCITQGAGIANKNGDYAKPTFDFMVSTDSTDTLGTLAFAEMT